MNNQFDNFTKSLAQSVTRRGALKQFGVGLAGMVIACIGLARNVEGRNAYCSPAGYKCHDGFLDPGGDPKKECHKCCNPFKCFNSGFGFDCYCQ
jgi:hypothetical protein